MEWTVGDLIHQRWEVHRVLKGGMGIVYIVYDRGREFRGVFAAKTFQDDVFRQGASTLQAFRHEAAIWIGLDIHPNITRAQYLHEIDGKPYLFLEYVNGGDLSEWIGSPKLIESSQNILALAMQFCVGMVHAVSKGLTAHRDIKPQNCLLTPDGTLKITDFGLAKVLERTDNRKTSGTRQRTASIHVAATRTGTLIGTPTHMAPEQFKDAKSVDIRADVYSFGVMLFQMISGRLPFPGKTWEDLQYHHLNSQPPKLNTSIPQLDSLVSRCLSKDPTDRFSDFSDLHRELAELYQKITGESAPPPKRGVQLTAFDLCNKGASLSSLGHTKSALQALQSALKLCPDDELSWINMGVVYHTMRDYGTAIKCYQKAIAINRNMAAAYFNFGLALAAQAHREEAIELFKKAVGIDPYLKEAWIELGRTFEFFLDVEIAEKCYKKALRIAPNDVLSINAYANYLTEANNAKLALSYYDKSLSINTEQERIWLNRGVALEKLGDFLGAHQSYKSAAAVNPASAEAWAYQGNALFHMSRFLEAIQVYDKALEIDNSLAQIWIHKGICLVENDCINQALECFRQANQLGHPRGIELIAECSRLLRK